MKPRPSLATALVLAACMAALAACRPAATEQTIHVEPWIRHLWSGEAVEFTVRVSVAGDAHDLSLGWEFELGGAVLARGASALEVAKGTSAPVAVRFEAPQVRHPCDVRWSLCLMRNQEEQAHRALSLRVYPAWDPEPLRKLLCEPTVAIADPSGSLLKPLSDLGLTARAVSTAVALRAFDGRVILLAPGAGKAPDLVKAALDAAAAGRTVVWFEPGDTSAWREPFGLPSAFANEPTPRFSLAPQHPALFSLAADDLSSWRDETAGFALAEPRGGNFRGLVATTGDQAGFRILELFPGSGRLVLCGLPVVSCFRAEPVARMLFESLLRYALSDVPQFRPATLWAPPESGLHALAERAGVVLAEGIGAPESLLIVAADEPALEYARRNEPSLAEKIRAHLHKCGKCIIIGAEPQSAAFLERCGLREVALTAAPEHADLQPQSLPLIWGLSPQQLNAAAHGGQAPLFPFAATAEDSQVAVEPGAIIKVRVGEGEAILCQISLGCAPDDPAGLAVFRQLMTNLGVRLQVKDEQ